MNTTISQEHPSKYTIADDVQKMIDKTTQRKAHCKKQVLEELLGIINNVCEENHLQYFAVGKLLAYAEYDEDYYPDDFIYYIGMARADYDLFFEEMKKREKTCQVTVMPFYSTYYYIDRLHSFIRMKRQFQDSLGKLEITLDLRVEPYDTLPNDRKEQVDFLKEIADFTRVYRAESKVALQNIPKGHELNTIAKIKRKLHFIKRTSHFKKRFHEYRNLLLRYHQKDSCEYIARVEMFNYTTHARNHIFPIGRKNFGKEYVMTPFRVEAFLTLPQDEESLKEINAKFDTLKKLDEICKKHNISYFLMDQLCAASHHIDQTNTPSCKESLYIKHLYKIKWNIGLLRNDFDKIISLLESDASTHGNLTLNRCVEDYYFIKDYTDRIYIEGYGKNKTEDKECSLNLYPFDSIPDNMHEFFTMQEQISENQRQQDLCIQREKGLCSQKDGPNTNSWEIYEKIHALRKQYGNTQKTPYYVYTIIEKNYVVLALKDIMPIQRKSFGNIMVDFPKNDFLWHEKKDEIYSRYVNKKCAQILTIIDQICHDQNFEYFAVTDLLVGAAVYKDFIPNSDDKPAEIGLLRSQYNTFLSFMRDHAKDYGLKLYEYMDCDNKIPLPIKFITLKEEQYPTTLKINLLPFDSVPEDEYCQRGFFEDMDQKNLEYEELFAYYQGEGTRILNKYSPEEAQKKKVFWETADPIVEAEKINQFAQSFAVSKHSPYFGCVAFKRTKIIHKKELYPIQKIPFCNMNLSCPRDYSPWQPVLDEELHRQVSCIQKACIPIIKELDRVCKELGIGYFICGGTLLGYMRHGGYIPWDDDIDLGMLRADYDLFLEKAGDLLRDGFFLQTREIDPNIPYLFSKIRLDHTEYCTEYNVKRDFHKGISIDIFPFDYLPNDLKERRAFVKEVTKLSKEHNFIARNQYPTPSVIHEPENELEAKYHQEQEEKRQYYWKQSLAESQKRYLDAATRYNAKAKEKGLKTVGSFVISYTYIDLENLLPYQHGVFEGVDIMLPKRPDTLMSMQYGDYMELPPEHQRVAHRLVRWATYEESGEKPTL